MKIALAGDTMLGRGVAERLVNDPSTALFSEEVAEIARSTDLFVLNLECCISTRGSRWTAPGKPFFFRAPPAAVQVLRHLGVGCVSLANNHALDFGHKALLDTFEHLSAGGIRWVGAGRNLAEARRPAVFEIEGVRVAFAAVTDHPADFAATADHPGVALADLRRGVPGWLTDAFSTEPADIVVVTTHWGPNMNPEPLDYVLDAADALVEAGAHLVAGHSAHVFQGVRLPVLYDLGDFVDDYATDPILRNDLGLLWLVELDGRAPPTVEAVPLKLDYCHTRLATGESADWIVHRFTSACARMGTSAHVRDGRLVVAD